MPSTLDIFSHISVLPSPLWHPKVDSVLNNAFPHFLDLLSHGKLSPPQLLYLSLLDCNNTIILKYPYTPSGLYSASQSTSCSSVHSSQSPSGILISLPNNSTEPKRQIPEGISFLRKKKSSLEVSQGSPQGQQD